MTFSVQVDNATISFQNSFNINQEDFSHNFNLVYAITCQSCNLIYVGETSRSLMVHFSEHLADIRHNCSKPVAQHFNPAGHTIADAKVKGLWQLHGDSWSLTSLRYLIGTMSPCGLNENVKMS